ncbi:DUF732 domain-containing protein [Paractinoplanes rishiriensis]|uniref:DUF732 domain-containing protein n=1 Tax=Paractinoplanes rishiriensis TaxID=1050105 RepID=A0A919K2U4_9ACTN|nr:DUF732 domain-containing protein [Actinoplanes rishiriensis]GIE99856.1 hypothetical protein Ari01nite_73210 [Actinoplanes rishiriensis]
MSGRWLLVAMVIGVSTLAGCSGGGSGSGPVTPAPTATSAAASSPPVTEPAVTAPAADTFVDVVRARLPEVALDRRDEEIQAIADAACADLAAGKDADDVVAAARSLGTLDAGATDHATARELIKLAIDLTCPEQARRVDEF